MKRKFAAACGVSAIFMTIVSFLLLRPGSFKVYAKNDTQRSAEENAGTLQMRLMKVIPLNPDEIVQIPRYIVEENAAYVLDESSIVVEETGWGSSEGADVVKFSRRVEDLSDNDLERIEKTAVHEGIDCELLSVVYEVAGEDENGVPISYHADCEYGGLKKYGTSYPVAWQMSVWYNFFETTESERIVSNWEEFEYIYVPAKQKTDRVEGMEEPKSEEIKNTQEKEEETVPKPEIKKFRVEPVPDDDGRMRNKIKNVLISAAAVTAGASVIMPFIIWFSILTAPLFSLKKGKYRYIGRIRLKKEDEIYVAYLTKRLFARAEIPVFVIKLPGRVRKRTKAGMLQIHCPDEKRILLTTGKEVSFTVEGD